MIVPLWGKKSGPFGSQGKIEAKEKQENVMNIGIPRERRPDEHRVGLTPAGVELLVTGGHRCYVEHDAGLGAGFSDEDFARAGAQIVYSGEEAYGRADLVVKVARPTANIASSNSSFESQTGGPGSAAMTASQSEAVSKCANRSGAARRKASTRVGS